MGKGETRSETRIRTLSKEKRSFPVKWNLPFLFGTGMIVALVAFTIVPVQDTSATTPKTGGNCGGNCHPVATSSFTTVTGFPGTTYVPGQIYRITVTIAESNGLTGDNHFNFIVSAGTLATIDSNVKLVGTTQTQVAANVVSLYTWSFDWTAPLSGAVTADVWAVDGGNGRDSEYDHATLGSAEIPEFPYILVPVAGGVVLLLVIRRRVVRS